MVKASPFILSLAILAATAMPGQFAWTQTAETREEAYLRHKARCDYNGALDILGDWSVQEKNADILELNLFRIMELLKYPEQFDTVMSILDRISENPLMGNTLFLQERLLLCRQDILLRKGNIREARRIRDRLGYLDFNLLGPFPARNSDEFEKDYIDEESDVPSMEIKGKTDLISWFESAPDLSGAINISELCPDSGDSYFYLRREVNITKTGLYEIVLGKSGFCDLKIDGITVYSSREKHGFSRDQYVITVFLREGSHRLIIKTGDSRDGIVLSCRLRNSAGNPQETDSVDTSGRRWTYFPALREALNRDDERSQFTAAYLYYLTGLNPDGVSVTAEYASRISAGSLLYQAASYYRGMAESVPDEKEKYLRIARSGSGDNLEALSEITAMKIRHHFFYEAWPLIEELERHGRSMYSVLTLKADFFLENKWHRDALKTADLIQNTAYSSQSHLYKARIFMDQDNYRDAAAVLEKILSLDRSNRTCQRLLIGAYNGMSDMHAIVGTASAWMALHPNDMDMFVILAKAVRTTQGDQAALPYLTAALKRSPYNKNILHQLGLVYHAMNKRDTALYYLRLSASHDPDNHALKQYIALLSGGEDHLLTYRWTGDLNELENRSLHYADEKAVYLLSETMIRVQRDGSFEKNERRIIKILNDEAIDSFRNQYIIYEPETETVGQVKCTVTNGPNSIEMSARYGKSLSDPESRLYYNLEALILPVTNLRRGSVIDFSYTIKNRGGAEYKNYFGEKITIGGQYRIIQMNVTLSHPEDKNIYLHTGSIDRTKILTRRQGSHVIFNTILSDIAPFKRETAMPNESQFLPVLYFTSQPSWNTLTEFYRSLLKNKSIISDEMRNALKKIIRPEDSPVEKTRKIFNHVTDEIRYVGFELGLGGIQPRSTDQTYHSRMGDCKDVSLLLAAMLREAGVPAHIALVRTRDRGTANLNVPFLGEFNHALCYVDLEGGFFLDGTVDNTGYRELPSDDRHVSALVIFDTGYRFIDTGSRVYAKNIDTVTNSITINSDGSVMLERELEKKGSSASSARQSLKNRDEKLKSLNEYWNDRFPGASVSSLDIQGMDRDEPVLYRYKVAIPSLMHNENGEIIFRPFLVPSSYYSNYAMIKARQHPLVFSDEWETLENLTYILPPGCTVNFLPESESFNHEKFTAIYRYSLTENTIVIQARICVRTRSIPQEEYEAFRSFTRFIDRKEMERIVLEKKP